MLDILRGYIYGCCLNIASSLAMYLLALKALTHIFSEYFVVLD